MVDLRKLWGNARFKRLHPLAKLLYCYLSNHPGVTTLGVVEVEEEEVVNLLGGDDHLAVCMEQLVRGGYIEYFQEGFLTVIVKAHWGSLSKTKTNFRRAAEEGKRAKGKLRKYFGKLYTPEDFVPPLSFTPPTPQEVSDFALSLGYLVNGKTFVDYYTDNDWYQKNNNKVRSWESVCKRVWCRDENRLIHNPDAPEGYEYFFIETEEGTRVAPEKWKDGMPMHSNLLFNEMLREEYLERVSRNS